MVNSDPRGCTDDNLAGGKGPAIGSVTFHPESPSRHIQKSILDLHCSRDDCNVPYESPTMEMPLSPQPLMSNRLNETRRARIGSVDSCVAPASSDPIDTLPRRHTAHDQTSRQSPTLPPQHWSQLLLAQTPKATQCPGQSPSVWSMILKSLRSVAYN
ncbi:hypothetical protein BSLG_002419 [Batrachochytrium salamandrivorans]|nr:hypothetical protein BSLG_002419 [Batrachochytrium salamandrivorans]